MSKRKFGFEGFGLNKQSTYNFERSQAPQRLYVPPSSRSGGHDHYEDTDLDNIDYDDRDTSNNNAVSNDGGGGGDDEIDPLDAFMEGIHEEMKAAPPPKAKEKVEKYMDDEEDDPMDTFLRSKKDLGLTLASEALHAGYDSDEEVYAAAKAVDAGMIEYDSDDNPIVVDRKKIEPIPPLDHSSIDYEPFNKDFYEEKPSISGMSEQDVLDYRKSVAIRVSGFDVPRPIKTFEDCGFSVELRKAITKQAYEKPTPIQCQALPIVLSGRDIIGIAKTGSGKTAAFVLPMIVHIMDQPELEKEEGPIGVVCAPTRELAHQIYLEAKKFSKSHGIRVSAVYGGMSKLEQFKELKAGCEIVIATPGRLIDLLKMKALMMSRATYLVLDEADRMFDLGFEPQIRSIVGQIRLDRQTLLFSATMPRKIEKLAREILTDPVRVTVGEIGMANEDITQEVQVLPSDTDKLPWLLEKLPSLIDNGDVLVFASKKVTVDEIENQLSMKGFKVAALHGDKDQASRMEILQKFKSGIYHVLIATDVAARGLDIKSIKSVVNFDIARDMDMHVHRIGRTGRAGDKDGTAYTLMTLKEARFAGELVNSLIAAGQNVSMELMDLAMKDGRFRSKRDARKGGGKRELIDIGGQTRSLIVMEVFGVRRYLRNKVRSIFDSRRHSPGDVEKGPDTVHHLKVSLEDLYNGTSKLIAISRQLKCSACQGKGTLSSSSNECFPCQGSGEIMNAVYPEEGVVVAEQQFCNMCKGTGRDISKEDPCPECKGRTMLVELQRLEVNVDKGMRNGHEIRIPGEADTYPFTEEPGDAVFVLEEMQHPKFKREGDNLLVEHALKPGEALSGFQFTLTHLDNRQLLIEIQPEEHDHQVIKKIKDEGMPIHERPFARGNLYIRFFTPS